MQPGALFEENHVGGQAHQSAPCTLHLQEHSQRTLVFISKDCVWKTNNMLQTPNSLPSFLG